MRVHPEHLGNPWFVCSFWLAQYYHDNGDDERAHKIMAWAAKKSNSSGILSEQIDSQDGSSIGVAPLVWSHAEYINTALDLANI
jgi:glucoamylase